jgi:hypothetical protein
VVSAPEWADWLSCPGFLVFYYFFIYNLNQQSKFTLYKQCIKKRKGRAVPAGRPLAQNVRRRLSTAVARVQARVRSCGICGEHSGTGAGFLRVLRFPLPIIPLTAPHSSSVFVRGWYKRSVIGLCNSGLGSAPQQRKINCPYFHLSTTP